MYLIPRDCNPSNGSELELFCKSPLFWRHQSNVEKDHFFRINPSRINDNKFCLSITCNRFHSDPFFLTSSWMVFRNSMKIFYNSSILTELRTTWKPKRGSFTFCFVPIFLIIWRMKFILSVDNVFYFSKSIIMIQNIFFCICS